ncbi:MAG: GNAT family N-acetyltransferase [Cytophagales bacterium]|nr:GNAT family N-acetyltransferase [Cytophagales bacterium]
MWKKFQGAIYTINMDLNFSESIVLENQRVRLSPLSLDNVDDLEEVASADKDLLQYSPIQVFNRDCLINYITDRLENRRDKLWYSFVVFDKQEGKYAGSTSFLNISNHDLRLEIGATWYGKKFQRTGLNRNCKVLLLSYLFETLGFERVEFRTDSRNIQSQTAIQKIGGKLEGTLRSHTLMLDGYRRDTVCYSILKGEWPEIKETVFKGF